MVTWKADKLGLRDRLKNVMKQMYSDRHDQYYQYNDGFNFKHTSRFTKYYTKQMYFYSL